MMRRVRDFHRDDRGLETLQVVLIVAVAALILGLLKFYWNDVKNFFVINVLSLLGFGQD